MELSTAITQTVIGTTGLTQTIERANRLIGTGAQAVLGRFLGGTLIWQWPPTALTTDAA